VFRTRVLGIAATLVFVGLSAAPAQANTYTQVLQAYETNGSVPPCQFSAQQLENALQAINTYGQQYFADFTAAVQIALGARASGACAKPSQVVHPATQNQGPLPPLRPGRLTAATGASLPAPILLMAGFAAVLGVLGAVAAVWWWRGWSPRWAARWRHAWSEAGYHTHEGAADFDDWLRSRE
jgi:hypothetical protein